MQAKMYCIFFRKKIRWTELLIKIYINIGEAGHGIFLFVASSGRRPSRRPMLSTKWRSKTSAMSESQQFAVR